MNAQARLIKSRDNPLLQRVRRLVADPGAYRKMACCWLEGEHLALALKTKGLRASHALISESAVGLAAANLASACSEETVVVPDKCFAEFSSLPMQGAVGLIHPLPPAPAVVPDCPTVVLDRIQDAGNVGSILRSASALGFKQVIALKGAAGLWSPKVLRSGMGAHFGLRLLEAQEAACLDRLTIPLLATSSHATQSLLTASWPQACGWIFGHEGQGVSPALLERCVATLRIPLPGGEESLNVASAAAICLYESMRRRACAT